jgi:hypothetical protein
MALLDDSPLVATSGRKPLRVYREFFTELTCNPIKETVLKLAAYADKILTESYLTGSDPENGSFIEEIRQTPIFKEYHLFWRSSDPRLAKYILTFLRFLKKMKYVDDEFQTTAFRNCLDLEDRLSELDLSTIEDEALLKRLVSFLIGRPETSKHLGHFGTGAVSEYGIRGSHSKAYHLTFDRRLSRILLESTVTQAVDPTLLLSSPYRYMRMAKEIVVKSTDSVAASRLRFVPKDLTKARSICMEPNSYMFAQQMVLAWFVDAFRKGPMRHFVKLEDQTFNQRGAEYGSTYMSLDTIDLSSASDTVHVELVRRIFPKIWWYYLLGTRTSYTYLPDGSMKKMEKFAPMGSAVCFPVQCVIFTALTLCSSLVWLAKQGLTVPADQLVNLSDSELESLLFRHFNRRWESKFSHHSKKVEMLAVYGDDILCDSRVTDDVMRRLRLLGFDVNARKSFRASQAYRESCGKYYYLGHDVTPLSFTIAFSQDLSPVHYASLIGACNNAFNEGYMNLRSAYIRILDLAIRNSKYFDRRARNESSEVRYPLLPFTTYPNLFGIRCVTLDLSGSRYNDDWQIEERRVLRVRTHMKGAARDHIDRHEAYQYSFVSQVPSLDMDDASLHYRKLRPEETRLYKGWTPCR